MFSSHLFSLFFTPLLKGNINISVILILSHFLLNFSSKSHLVSSLLIGRVKLTVVLLFSHPVSSVFFWKEGLTPVMLRWTHFVSCLFTGRLNIICSFSSCCFASLRSTANGKKINCSHITVSHLIISLLIKTSQPCSHLISKGLSSLFTLSCLFSFPLFIGQ